MHRSDVLILLSVVLCVAGMRELHGDERANIDLSRMPSALFADAEVDLQMAFPDARRAPDGVVWALTTRAQRTLSRGRARITAEPVPLATIHLHTPPVRPGVVLPAVLSLRVSLKAGGEPSLHEHPLWLFPPDPFSERTQWLQQLNIRLYDPALTTGQAFKAIGIPFEAITRSAGLRQIEQGLLVVGEGASLSDERGLTDSLLEIAGRGVAVLCLAPADGEFTVPQNADPTSGQPPNLFLRGEEFTSQLDHRLDFPLHPAGSPWAASRIVLAGDAGRLVARVQAGDDGWPWFEVHFAEQRGRLLVCNYGFMRSWDSGPTPRYLLARLFEYLTGDVEANTIQERNSSR